MTLMHHISYRRNVQSISCLLVALLGSSGCEYVHLHYTDCRYYDGPRLDRLVLKRPMLNQEYAENVRILLDDDRNIYHTEFWLEYSGSLPQGISYYQDNRTLFFEGAATSLGIYSFTVTAIARYAVRDRYLYGDYYDYCSFRTAHTYQLMVEPF